MMSAVAVADSQRRKRVDAPSAVRERLEEFGREVLAEATNRPAQSANGNLYLRGLLEEGQRKSLEPLVDRLGGQADYQSMQQFLTDSPWDPSQVLRAVAERVVPEIEIEAWVLDDTGFPKDGKRSPGVKRQYSGTLGKIGNCQIGVSVHAVGAKGTVPLGWALYLPEEWCEDPERRREAKIPEDVSFKTKPELGAELIERASGWEVPAAPLLGDSAYGENTDLRRRLDAAGSEYVLSVSPQTAVFSPETTFEVPERKGKAGRPRTRPQPDRAPESIGALIERIGLGMAQNVAFRDGPDGEPVTSLRLRAGARLPRVAEAALSAARGVVDRRVARGRRCPHRLLVLQPSPRHRARAACPPRPDALEGRARLPPAQGRARARPLRGPLLPRLAPPHRIGHSSPRLPHPGASSPFSPTAGLTLPAAVRAQPLFKCWTGRCQTCDQPVDLERLSLHRYRQDE
jgi:SRSO17 transposase